jgi:hypothetical protein
MYMLITKKIVTYRKDIFCIAEVRDEGVNTPGYIPTSTEAYTTDITLVVGFPVAALACLLTASVIIYKSNSFNLTGHKLSDIFFIIIHTSYVRL